MLLLLESFTAKKYNFQVKENSYLLKCSPAMFKDQAKQKDMQKTKQKIQLILFSKK
jgi:hypothetical protein